MKKMNHFWAMAMLLFAIVACTTDSDNWDSSANSLNSTIDSDDDNSTTTACDDNVVNGVSSEGNVTTFSVALNKNAISESVKVDASDDDYIENTTFTKTITITFNATGSATVSGDDEGIVSINGNDVIATNNGNNIIKYILTGETTDGFFKLYSPQNGTRSPVRCRRSGVN